MSAITKSSIQLLFLFLSFLSISPAATVQANYLELLSGMQVRRTIGTAARDLSVGLFHFQQVGGTHDLHGDDPHFYAFCVEPLETVQSGVFTFATLDKGNTLLGGMGVTRANRLSELYTRYAPVIHVSLLDSLTIRALQVATWEIVRETNGTLNVTSGNVRFGNPSGDSANNALRASVYTRANQMLTSLTGLPGDRNNNFYALTRLGFQDVIVTDTPEPGTVVMMALGLAGIFWRRQRKSSTTAQRFRRSQVDRVQQKLECTERLTSKLRPEPE